MTSSPDRVRVPVAAPLRDEVAPPAPDDQAQTPSASTSTNRRNTPTDTGASRLTDDRLDIRQTRPGLTKENPMSPGIIGLYWLAASFATATLWHLAARGLRRRPRPTRTCYCGTCDR